MHIGLIGDVELVNTNYRANLPLAAVEQRNGHTVLRSRNGGPPPTSALAQCDVVHVHRYASTPAQEIVRTLRTAGVGIVWDNDDDVTALPRSNPLYRTHGGAKARRKRADIAQTVKLADVVTTPSAVLAEQYRELGARDVRVVENHLPGEWLDTRRVEHEGVVVAWLAGLEHQVDAQELGIPDVLAGLLDAHSDVRVLSVGLGLGLRSDRYRHIRGVPFPQLIPTLAGADVGIAPLTDIPWNRARSSIKVKEYSAAGLAWLASPVGPYAELGERQGGRLVPDDRWAAELSQIVGSARARRKLAKRAVRWAKGETIEQHVAAWESVFQDAAARGRARRASR